MDDFSTLTFREPWLLEKFFYFYCFHLASRKESMLQGRCDSRQGTKSTEISKRPLWGKGKATKGVPKFSCTKDDFVRKLQNNLAHTFNYPCEFELLTSHYFKVQKFPKLMRCTYLWRHYAHAHVVWCSWCTLEWLAYPSDELGIAKAILGREGIWMASRFLTTKIPSALLVAVVWLQHTRCPRFRRGTFGYRITLSPIKRGRVGVRSFHADAR
jgi:hypothetical protein